MSGRDGLAELRLPVRYFGDAVDVPDPLTRVIRIGPALAKRFFVLAVLENKTIRRRSDIRRARSCSDGAGLVLVLKRRRDDLLRRMAMILAV
jgi:hypothetical protein